MTRSQVNQRSLILLLLGFASAIAIYAFAEPGIDDPLLSDPRGQKKYLREMEVYGGKANVVSAQFIEWFEGLWHGQNLAYTVAVLAVGATLAYRFVALPLPPQGNAPAVKPKSPASKT